MTTRRTPITRASAERLLTARSGGGTELRRVLAAASAPPTANELRGEPAAMAQFRAVRLNVVTPARRNSVLKTAAAKLLAANVVIGATVAAATGGVALAAATNHLPGPLHHANAPVAVRESHSQEALSASNRPSPLPTPTTTPGRSGAHPSGSTTHRAQGSPSPSMVGLCTAYQAAVADNPGKALDNPAFTALITAAGGKGNVAAYCATVLASSSGTPSHPTAAPSTHSSAPTTHPTAGPSISPGRP
jgi:hypothetical protein